MNIGIIGYGSMGKMLLEKLVNTGNMCDMLYVSNRNIERMNDIDKRVTICKKNSELAEAADIVIICVRPVDMKPVLEDIKKTVRDETIIISLNGSVSFETMGKIIVHKMAKVIPSVTAEINCSQTLMCFNEHITDSDKEKISYIFKYMGTTIELPENEMGMGSELVSCMPGFIASIFDVICVAAKKHTSIPEEQVIKMVLNTLCATGKLMIDKEMLFDDIVTRVATKGGITEEGTKVIYEAFPKLADEIFHKTLEKRKQTAQKAEALFG